MPQLIGGTQGLARTGSGLIVPAGMADAAKVSNGAVARDIDGRRRVVFTDQERRTIDRAAKILKGRGFAYVLVCWGGKEGKQEDGTPVCGQPMQAEALDTKDPGYGCKCSRIHFSRT
jgi:hypothetical protein